MRNKIIMITAMLAVMVAMTGIAAATYVNIDSSYPILEPDIIYNPLDGSTITTTDVVFASLPYGTSVRNIKVLTSDSNLYARVYATGIDTTFGNNIGATAIWTWTWAAPGSKTFSLDVKGTTTGIVTVYDMANGQVIGQAGVNAGSADVNVPKFPTVALPIAAVIGLVFFFQQKKRKEE